MRYAIELAYKGTNYHGWQEQLNAPSVQSELELALTKLNGNHPVKVVGCGRTDTGVHASYYVAHFDLDRSFDIENAAYKLNKILTDSIVVFSVQQVPDEFHARFSATKRTYHYFLHAEKSAFIENSLYYPHFLDFEKMNLAAKDLIGKKDFTSFSKLHTDVKTNICDLSKAEWIKVGEQFCFIIEADRFLRNMVRAIVGTLMEVGTGKLSVDAIPEILKAMDRGEAKLSVPAKGLFLADIEYPEYLFRSNRK